MNMKLILRSKSRLWMRCKAALLVCLFIGLTVALTEAADIVVDGSKTFQTIDGFGVNVNAKQWGEGNFKGALDQMVDDLGASLFRLYIDNTDWEAQNDDNDPYTFNDEYYDAIFTSARMERLWNTWSYLNSKGITNGIILNFMGWGPDWLGGHTLPENPILEEEFVETIIAVVRYGVLKRGLKLGWLAPFNEPDWNCMEGICVNEFQMKRLLRSFGSRLRELGIDAGVVAPDTAFIDNAANRYLPEVMTDSESMQSLSRWGVHNYGGDSGSVPDVISNSDYPKNHGG